MQKQSDRVERNSGDSIAPTRQTLATSLEFGSNSTERTNSASEPVTSRRVTALERALPDLVLDQLLFLREKAKVLRNKIARAEKRLAQTTIRLATRKQWLEYKYNLRAELHLVEDRFWEINCPNVEHRAKHRLEEYLTGKELETCARSTRDSDRLPVSEKNLIFGSRSVHH